MKGIIFRHNRIQMAIATGNLLKCGDTVPCQVLCIRTTEKNEYATHRALSPRCPCMQLCLHGLKQNIGGAQQTHPLIRQC